jgi:UPF0176 protein
MGLMMQAETQTQRSPGSHAAYANIAAYKFVNLENTSALRPVYQAICTQLNLRGTILLTPEGINLFLCGLPHAITQFVEWLRSDTRLREIDIKWSYSGEVAFKRMVVKLKKEIITMRMPVIKPEQGRAPAVDPKTLKRWLDQGHDDAGKPVVMMDTRNGFEVDLGTFENILEYRIRKFTEFPAIAAAYKDQLTDTTIVTFCTGGIRCEKAALYMQTIGYDNVYQLDGGILKYFEEVGGAHYRGDCFVFDERTALNPDLEPATPVQEGVDPQQ